MGPAAQLKPITREVLRAFYSKYPLEPVPTAECEELVHNMEQLALQLAAENSDTSKKFALETPRRIDECFWRNRQFCEEIAYSLAMLAKHFEEKQQEACTTCKDLLLRTERKILDIQEKNTQAAASQIRQFLPKDFRGSLLEMRRNQQEKTNQKAVDDLIKNGGSIRDRYELYLKQQWERRESLAQMGQLTGVYKILVKYMAGVPQVLLDFAKEINAKLGPMEEQRVTYGPDLYKVTTLGIRIDVCAAVWAESRARPGYKAGVSDTKVVEALQTAINFYAHHVDRVISFLGEIFSKSPFFVTAADIEAANTSMADTHGGAGSRNAAGQQTHSVNPLFEDARPSACSQSLHDVPEDLSLHPGLNKQHGCLPSLPATSASTARRLSFGDAAKGGLAYASSHSHGERTSAFSVASDAFQSADDNQSWLAKMSVADHDFHDAADELPDPPDMAGQQGLGAAQRSVGSTRKASRAAPSSPDTARSGCCSCFR
mmetsp:Transcript_18611/g.39978  ORF Transcript_18611/g.39978 Transcript_18611/m.39978 type:complete len:487 (+) Transcript_18611:206-1666(+)|eukprot:CAMPEP_0202890654 /NCGR_PEP_ID=MMETSP1392-20130828/991_1 /ASSEMBLY_ACC=CAM_ASM_000868 /TAXON_ID=225041 /ORGANISM="Chlamydomonas chlamydogama, Strain SAG 11-48b" /LENGTH=486 /DNA_ID=CAMNT_0049574269 /DNA_START=106 /DNA_END=1566 /DNA_ORIENTATION=+